MIIRLLPTYIYLFMEAQNAQPFHSNVQRWNFGLDNSNIYILIGWKFYSQTKSRDSSVHTNSSKGEASYGWSRYGNLLLLAWIKYKNYTNFPIEICWTNNHAITPPIFLIVLLHININLSIYIPIYLSIICVSLYLSVYLFICVYKSIYQSINLSIYQSINLSIY